MEHNQFETLMLAITGLKGEMSASNKSLRDEMNASIKGFRDEMNASIKGFRDEMNASIKGFRDEMNNRFNIVDERFDRLEFEVRAMGQQVAQTHVEVADLKKRVSKLESPLA